MYQRAPQSKLAITSPGKDRILSHGTTSKVLSPAMTRARRASVYQRKQSPAKNLRKASVLTPPKTITRARSVKSPAVQKARVPPKNVGVQRRRRTRASQAEEPAKAVGASKIPIKPKVKSPTASQASKKRKSTGSPTELSPKKKTRKEIASSKSTPKTRKSGQRQVSAPKMVDETATLSVVTNTPRASVVSVSLQASPLTSFIPPAEPVMAPAFTKLQEPTLPADPTPVSAEKEPQKVVSLSKKKTTPGRKIATTRHEKDSDKVTPGMKKKPAVGGVDIIRETTSTPKRTLSAEEMATTLPKKSTPGRKIATPKQKVTPGIKKTPAQRKYTPGRNVLTLLEKERTPKSKSLSPPLKKTSTPARVQIKVPTSTTEKTPAKLPKRKLTPGRAVPLLSTPSDVQSTKKMKTTPSRAKKPAVSQATSRTPPKAARVLGKTPLTIPRTRRTKTTPHTPIDGIDTKAIFLSDIQSSKTLEKLEENGMDSEEVKRKSSKKAVQKATNALVEEKSWSVWNWCTIL